jgi:hypothetical protein
MGTDAMGRNLRHFSYYFRTYLEGLRKTRQISLDTADLGAETYTTDFSNTKRVYCPLISDIRHELVMRCLVAGLFPFYSVAMRM